MEITSHLAQGERSPPLDITRFGTIVIQIYCECVCEEYVHVFVLDKSIVALICSQLAC